jgi:hypothetical protein
MKTFKEYISNNIISEGLPDFHTNLPEFPTEDDIGISPDDYPEGSLAHSKESLRKHEFLANHYEKQFNADKISELGYHTWHHHIGEVKKLRKYLTDMGELN